METEDAAFDPPIGIAEQLEPGLRRIVAPNPSPMTFRGTNTYLVGETDLAVIDPGPDSRAHLDAILGALGPGERISHIFVTHAHLDHSSLARPLAERTGAPVMASGPASAGRTPLMAQIATDDIGGGEGVDAGFDPDRRLADEELVTGAGWQISALWTPGHMANHMAFEWRDTIFTGDLVMGWASSLVSPPDGDMSAFFASCARLRARAGRVIYPAHGAAVAAPVARIDGLVQHRMDREVGIRKALARGPMTPADLVTVIYTDIEPRLRQAAERNVFAHLIDLVSKGHVKTEARIHQSSVFAQVTPDVKKTN